MNKVTQKDIHGLPEMKALQKKWDLNNVSLSDGLNHILNIEYILTGGK